MQVIILTNDPCAREVFDLTRRTNAYLVMDFRNGDCVFSRPNGLSYSLGIHYCQLHHHFFPAAVIRRLKHWSHPDMPMIIIIDKSKSIHALRSTVLRDYPLTEFIEGMPCAA